MQISFHGISRLKFLAIRARLRAQADRMEWTDDTILATGDGITTGWRYDEAAQSLAVTCTKPWWRSDGWAASRIQGLVEGL